MNDVSSLDMWNYANSHASAQKSEVTYYTGFWRSLTPKMIFKVRSARQGWMSHAKVCAAFSAFTATVCWILSTEAKQRKLYGIVMKTRTISPINGFIWIGIHMKIKALENHVRLNTSTDRQTRKRQEARCTIKWHRYIISVDERSSETFSTVWRRITCSEKGFEVPWGVFVCHTIKCLRRRDF